jgi:hypothetical protein
MKILKLDRYNSSNKLYAITLFGMRFDWRRWYQIWVNKGEDVFDKEHVGWSNVWLSWGELQDDLWYDLVEIEDTDSHGHVRFESIKRKTPKDWKYRKIPLILTICNWSTWWYKNKKLLAGILIGFLLSLLI